MIKKFYVISTSFLFSKGKLSFKLLGWTDNLFIARIFFDYYFPIYDDLDIHVIDNMTPMEFLLYIKKFYNMDSIDVMDLEIKYQFSSLVSDSVMVYKYSDEDFIYEDFESSLNWFIDDNIGNMSSILNFYIGNDKKVLEKILYFFIRSKTYIKGSYGKRVDPVLYYNIIGNNRIILYKR